MIRDMLTRNIGALWETHAGVLRAAVEVTSYDPEFAKFYNGLMDDFIGATAGSPAPRARRREAAPGRRSRRSAEVLVWMGERCHYVGLLKGRPPRKQPTR